MSFRRWSGCFLHGAKGIGLLVTAWLCLAPPAIAQQGPRTTVRSSAVPQVDRATSVDWALHMQDLTSSRYSRATEFTADNVANLEVKWTFKPTIVAGAFGLPDEAARSSLLQNRNSFFQQTPIVIDGVMYVHSGSRLYAVDAATGARIWSFETEPFVGEVRQRGPAYGDGRVYAHGPRIVYAVDARTGRLVESFGRGGLLNIVGEALRFKYPDTYPSDFDATTIGFELTAAPIYHDGTLYMGTGFGDGHTPGGFMMAVDGTTGAIKWAFQTIPQEPGDDGWEIARDTWEGGARAGGGVWTPGSIDPELGTIYFMVGNPSPAFDGSARRGINLFSNSIIALELETGTLKWHFQGVHHEIWDWDFMTTPLLFDVQADDRIIKAVGTSGKTHWPFFFNRETGEPLNPIVEMPVPTTTDVPGEQPWPTQPIPHNARGVQMEPFCFTHPMVSDPTDLPRVRTLYHPLQVEASVIVPSANSGFGGNTFSPRTGLFYVKASCGASSTKVRPVGNTLAPGPGPERPGFFQSRAGGEGSSVRRVNMMTAYDPITGEQVWRTEAQPGPTGMIVTATDLLFQISSRGDFIVFDASSGQQIATFGMRGSVSAAPLMYQVNGKQYISVVMTDTLYTFGLP